MKSLRQWARLLKSDTIALWFAVRDPRTPWIARIVAGLVVAYALSPIDLIPDFIPVLGLLDDIILVPLGLALAIRLIPRVVMDDARQRALALTKKPRNWLAAALIVLVWVGLAALCIAWLMRVMSTPAG